MNRTSAIVALCPGLVPVAGDPQGEDPGAADAGYQRKGNRAGDGVGRERAAGNQSGGSGEQARMTEHRRPRKEGEIDPIERREVGLALHEDDGNLIDEAGEPTEAQNEPDWPHGRPGHHHGQALKQHGGELKNRWCQEGASAMCSARRRQVGTECDGDEQQPDQSRGGRPGHDEEVVPAVEHFISSVSGIPGIQELTLFSRRGGSGRFS